MSKRWEEYRYLATALDPIHIGTGGYRLGRVDLTICREPVTNVPKIPGTSMSGAIKFFADMALMDEGKEKWCASTQGSKRDHARNSCPICYAFGYTPESGAEHDSRQGILDFGDALLLLFPVRTMLGPVWITSPVQIERFLNKTIPAPIQETFALPDGSELFQEVESNGDKLNIGWLYLDYRQPAAFTVQELIDAGLSEIMAKRVVLLPERIFEHVVNDQLEVRTSVVIDPTTGAAQQGGLFTYEAVPRGSVFITSIIVNDYSKGWEKVEKLPGVRDDAISLVDLALEGLEAVGIGGMTTRGFGRIKLTKMPKKEVTA